MVICNGVKSPRILYNKQKKDGLKKIIADVRKDIEKQFGGRDDDLGLFAGTRFADDDSVIARLESANQDEIQRDGWKMSVMAALIDCMKSDYYYTFEKEY